MRDVDRKGPRLLRLAPVEDDVRQCLIAGDLDAEAHPVATHWDRSRRLGADPDGGHWIESGVVDADLRREAIDATDDIWHPARAILSGFGRACERTDHVAVLSDARGVVARTLGGGDFADTARRLRLVEGALWDETTRGTNAIGTALAVGRPVSVEGGAHFARVNGELICLATPIRDPHGRVVAVLDATSRVERLGALPPEVILTVARAIEEVLRARVYAGASALSLVERVLEHASDAAFLVERPGRVVRANHAGRQLLAGRRTDEVLPTFEELAGAIESGPLERQEVDLGGARVRWTVEPVADAAGDVLALLVFAETGAPPARSYGHGGARPHGAPSSRSTGDAFLPIVGDDPAIETARETAGRLAATGLPVLLLAETGTGKELFARAIHAASARRSGPLVSVNCGALPADLVASELFGHGPGAFTGAAARGSDGLIAAADGGTLFLDEVADLGPEAQVSLLRVLETGTFSRIGEATERRVDLRVVAATCQDLQAAVRAGTFREDLYFRIGGAVLPIPPLRERSDIALLAGFLWDRLERRTGREPRPLAPALLVRLAEHDWPGNVRELESTLEYVSALAVDADAPGVEHLPATLAPRSLPPAAGCESTGGWTLAHREALERALRAAGGNVSAAARELGVARSTVYRAARRFGLNVRRQG
ncbi:MAG: sigma-54-dependent Fis family transcriptional regulator [Planctomycetota bacterium]